MMAYAKCPSALRPHGNSAASRAADRAFFEAKRAEGLFRLARSMNGCQTQEFAIEANFVRRLD
jgi:hypothetical protein